MHAVTIVARNYLPQARVLAASFRSHHPEVPFSTVVIDGIEADRATTGVGQVVLVADLGLPTAEWHAMAAIYTVMEFATAVKAAAVRHLLRTAVAAHTDVPPAVIYLDPDIQVMQPLTEVFAAAASGGIALTPHVLQPMPRDGLTPDEMVIRHAGVFNLGFIGVGADALPFLDWWHDRLRTDCVVDLPNALFTDQRWVDWAPALFPTVVLRNPGLNVAYWNLHERPLSRDDDGTVRAGGQPVVFFHFSGYDPQAPWRLSKHGGSVPRARIESDPVLRSLTDEYGRLLLEAGFGTRHEPYGLDSTAGGERLVPIVRAALRRHMLRSAADGDAPPPDPFEPTAVQQLREWFEEPVVGPAGAPISAWEHELYLLRTDLQAAFPDLGGAGAFQLRQWFDHDPYARGLRAEIGLGASTRAATERRLQHREPFGWNLVGYLHSEHGVGDAARRLGRAVDLVGMPNHPVAVRAGGSRHQHHVVRQPGEALRYRDSIYCINADELPRVAAILEHTGPMRGDARRVGMWFWEVDRFPDEFHRGFELLDEVWVTSEYTRDVLAAVAPVPVRLVPLPVAAPARPTPYTRRMLGLPDGFTFVFSFDFHSLMHRKNPLDTVRAYRQAFSPTDGAHLVIKSINGHQFLDHYDRLRRAVADRPDIHVIDGHWTADEIQGLIELSDCFVSLHRCEGFGLHLAAAMAAGRPVIATGHSGNMTFMDDETAMLVPFDLVPVGEGHWPYPADAQWAQPDLEAAAQAMRVLFDQSGVYARIAEAGRAHVLRVQSIERTVAAISPVLLQPLDYLPLARSSR
ncbi:MAG: glycosyltransferase family 4 protein [Actinomycetota bacterium]|nr:glycosyltransferase family 4 protein [Actinomycetota bacterium]